MIFCFYFFEEPQYCFQSTAPFYIHTNNAQGFQFLHILTNICYFFTEALLVSVKENLTVVLICISLMTSATVPLFMCLTIFYLLFPIFNLAKFFCHWGSSLHILDINRLSAVWFRIFSLPFHQLPFHSFHWVLWCTVAVAAAKSLQSCPTLCDPIDGSPPGSAIPGILQAKTLEWVAISFSNAWKWKVKVKSFSCVWLLATPWTAAYQAPPSMGFSRQEYWSGVPLPSLPLMHRHQLLIYCFVLLTVFSSCLLSGIWAPQGQGHVYSVCSRIPNAENSA